MASDPTSPAMDVLFAGVAVSHIADAAAWYARLFGRDADIVAHEREVMWRVTDSGWLYVTEDADRCGTGLVAIAVPDLDAALAELADRGVHGGDVVTVGGVNRKATLTDPDGNEVALVEVAPAAAAADPEVRSEDVRRHRPG